MLQEKKISVYNHIYRIATIILLMSGSDSTLTECHIPLDTLYLIYDYSDYVTWLRMSSLNHYLLTHYRKFRRNHKNSYTKYTIKTINKKNRRTEE
jgi:hypothetical protein